MTENLIWVIPLGIVVFGALRWLRNTLFTSKFEQRPIMNKSEQFLFDLLRREFPRDWHVMSQVSYGAFLGNASKSRYMTINAKRADTVVFDPRMNVAAVFEYQGAGHYGNDRAGHKRAELSDKVKRQACAEAGVAFVEIPAKIDRVALQRIIKKSIEGHS